MITTRGLGGFGSEAGRSQGPRSARSGQSSQGIGFACEIMPYSYLSSGMSTALAEMAKIGVPASS